jgi:hypothetical protein
MNEDAKEIAITVTKEIANSPKINALFGSCFAFFAAFWEAITGVTADRAAIYIGIAVALVSLYNQVMIAIRSHRKDKKKD